MLKIGQAAPEFSVASTTGQVSLQNYKGKWLILLFYPLDFTPV